MKNTLRSNQTTQGKRAVGARSLWRANGMKSEHFGKPIIGIANSFTQMVPGHAHLHNIGQEIKEVILEAGYFAAEFNTIAIDDGIAMGHDGMLYSLPSRDIIADSVEYVANAHKIDALICISNCDKITPGMLMVAMRLNIPTIFVSGGPMEAGLTEDGRSLNLVDAMVVGADPLSDDKLIEEIENKACPTCGSCSGMFTANSMNCLVEALGLGLPTNGTLLATHKNRKKLFEDAAYRIIEMSNKYYTEGDDSVLPHSIATRNAFINAMTLDIAMGGSSNTVLHTLAIAHEADVDFTMSDIDIISRRVPVLCKVAPNRSYHIQDVHRAGGIMAILKELKDASLLHEDELTVNGMTLGKQIDKYTNYKDEYIRELYLSAPGNMRNLVLGSQDNKYDELDLNRVSGCIRDVTNAYSSDGGLAVLFGNIAKDGCIVKTAGVDSSILTFEGKAIIFESQEDAMDGILANKVTKGDVVIIRYEGPKGGPGMQEMLYPTSYLKAKQLDKHCALLTDGRFSGGTSGLSIGHVSPEAAAHGLIALIEDGDIITIDIPNRRIELNVDDNEIENRKSRKKEYKPKNRNRVVSKSLKAYAHFVSSADKGAIREL